MKSKHLKTKISQYFKKVEWSKKFCAAIALSFGINDNWCEVEYYKLCKMAIELSSTMPDVTLAVVSVSTVIASLVSYLLYQPGLKNSRNKYGIDADGQPFKTKIEDSTDNYENTVE